MYEGSKTMSYTSNTKISSRHDKTNTKEKVKKKKKTINAHYYIVKLLSYITLALPMLL